MLRYDVKVFFFSFLFFFIPPADLVEITLGLTTHASTSEARVVCQFKSFVLVEKRLIS